MYGASIDLDGQAEGRTMDAMFYPEVPFYEYQTGVLLNMVCHKREMASLCSDTAYVCRLATDHIFT